MTRRIFNHEIAGVVAHLWGVEIADLRGRSIARRFSDPRIVAYWLARQVGFHHVVIARFYGRHYTTIVQGVGAVVERKARDFDFAVRVAHAAAVLRATPPGFVPRSIKAWPRSVGAPAEFQMWPIAVPKSDGSPDRGMHTNA